jgi:predicted RNA-binding Zn-ribbon protein involved in translation (DUF1610 family)
MTLTKRCPACGAEVEAEAAPSWFGLRRRYPSRCRSCGSALAYDTTGGIYAVPESKDDDSPGAKPREPKPQ